MSLHPRTGRRRAGFCAATLLATTVAATGAFVLTPHPVHAEYRAYELEVTDILDCKLNKRDKCRTARMVTSMSPDLYQQTNGGEDRIGVQTLATWMCYGDTSEYREVCARPPTRNGKFNPGDEVRITLKKHITEGWRGKVEVAYFQAELGSNVYGVRFPDRQNAYLRYFEKDLERVAAAPGQQPAAGQPGAPGTATPAPGGAPSGQEPAPAPGAPAPTGGTSAPAGSTPTAAPAAAGTPPTTTGAPPAQPAPAPAVAPTAPVAPAAPGAPGAPAVTPPAAPAPVAPAGPRAVPPQ